MRIVMEPNCFGSHYNVYSKLVVVATVVNTTSCKVHIRISNNVSRVNKF